MTSTGSGWCVTRKDARYRPGGAVIFLHVVYVVKNMGETHHHRIPTTIKFKSPSPISLVTKLY